MSQRSFLSEHPYFVKTAAWFVAWFASIELADVQLVVSIISGVAVGLLAALNAWVTYRDKIKGDK